MDELQNASINMFQVLKEGALDEWRDFRNDITTDYRRFNRDCKQLKKRLRVENNSSELILRKQVRNYERELRSRDFISDLNETVRNKISSAESLISYYQSRPEMTEYTLSIELPRMDYTVWTKTGEKLTTTSSILSYQKKTADQESNDNDLLWRCSNQSILGDVIAALMSQEGLIRPQVQAGTCTDDVSMVIDFGCAEPYLRAECFLNVSIPDNSLHGESCRLAGALVTAYFCPSRQEFHARVTQIFPCKAMTENQLNRIVKEIAL